MLCHQFVASSRRSGGHGHSHITYDKAPKTKPNTLIGLKTLFNNIKLQHNNCMITTPWKGIEIFPEHGESDQPLLHHDEWR